MGKQSSRIYFLGNDHKEIYFQGHYHDKMYIGSTLVWEKLADEQKEWWGIIMPASFIVYNNKSYGAFRSSPLTDDQYSDSTANRYCLAKWSASSKSWVLLKEICHSGEVSSQDSNIRLSGCKDGIVVCYASGSGEWHTELLMTNHELNSAFSEVVEGTFTEPSTVKYEGAYALSESDRERVYCGDYYASIGWTYDSAARVSFPFFEKRDFNGNLLQNTGINGDYGTNGVTGKMFYFDNHFCMVDRCFKNDGTLTYETLKVLKTQDLESTSVVPLSNGSGNIIYYAPQSFGFDQILVQDGKVLIAGYMYDNTADKYQSCVYKYTGTDLVVEAVLQEIRDASYAIRDFYAVDDYYIMLGTNAAYIGKNLSNMTYFSLDYSIDRKWVSSDNDNLYITLKNSNAQYVQIKISKETLAVIETEDMKISKGV